MGLTLSVRAAQEAGCIDATEEPLWCACTADVAIPLGIILGYKTQQVEYDEKYAAQKKEYEDLLSNNSIHT